MALLIAIANQKGGCGKTTTTMNLAGGLQKAGYKVLVIDADPQASSLAWSIGKSADSLPFSVIPARQARNLEAMLQDKEIDLILVDCPPGMADAKQQLTETQYFARKAVRTADAVLVPMKPSTLDFTAASSFVRYLGENVADAAMVMVLVNGVERTNLSKQAPGMAAVLFAPLERAHVLLSKIGDRVQIAETAGSGETIYDYAPGSPAAREYTDLTKEIIKCLANEPASESSTAA